MEAEMKRNPTRSVRVGSVTLGSGHPVAVQSMCATRTQDVDATVEQAEAIRRAGGGLVRVAVDSPKDVEALAEVRRQTKASLVVDLQESYRLAETVAPHVDKVRYNPGHLWHHEKTKPVREKVAFLVGVAREHDLALRIGVNCGSVDPEVKARFPGGRRAGHGRVGPRALPVHGRARLRPLRGEPQGLAPAQGHRGQPALRRGAAGRAAPPRRDGGGDPAGGRHQDPRGLRAAALPRHRGHPAGEPDPPQPPQARGGDGRAADPRRRRRRALPLGARLRRRQAQHHLLPLLLAGREREVRRARREGEGDDLLRGEARPDHRGHGVPRERPGRDGRRRPRPLVRPDPRQPQEEDRVPRRLHLRRDPAPAPRRSSTPSSRLAGASPRPSAGGRGACRPTRGRRRPSASPAP